MYSFVLKIVYKTQFVLNIFIAEQANSTHSFTAGLVCSHCVEHTVDITTFKSSFNFIFIMFILIKTRKDFHRKKCDHLRELFELLEVARF